MKEMLMWDKYDNKYRNVVDVECVRQLEADLYECNNIISDYIDVVKQKDKIINKMAEQLRGMAVLDTDKDEMIILGDDEDVIKYYEGKVE